MSLGVGRRSLYLYGLCGLFSMLFIMGFLGLVGDAHRDQAALATGSLMIVWALFYQLTVGTVCYSLVAELSTRRLQIKTVVLGRNLYNIAAIITNVLTPYMVNPSAWDWGVSRIFSSIVDYSSVADTRRIELHGILLGWAVLPLHSLYVLQDSGTTRPYVRRA